MPSTLPGGIFHSRQGRRHESSHVPRFHLASLPGLFTPGKTLIAPVSPGMRHGLLADAFDLQLKRGFHRAQSKLLSTKEALSVGPLPTTLLSHRLVL